MIEGRARISTDVLATYAADAAREAPGVRGLVGSRLPGRDGVRISESKDGEITVELHLAVEWGESIPKLGRDVQRRVGEYLTRMADVRPAAVDVVVAEIGPER